MAGSAIGQREETAAVSDFLTSASSEPVALVVEGDPGVGKTTLWFEAVRLAVEQGFHVLTARPVEAESLFGYATLGDLMGCAPDAVLGTLPPPQRIAKDRVLLQASPGDEPVDPRAVGAAFLTAAELLAQTKPVLIAIDDLPWVDPSSAHAIAFAARRLSSRVGVLGTVRIEPGTAGCPDWLQLRDPDAVRRIRLQPLTLGHLQAVLFDRLGKRFPRSTMARIHEISGGNPFYALELAREIDPRARDSDVPMPRNLTELVRARIGSLPAEAHHLLLAAACLPAPTVELIAHATRTDPNDVIEQLAEAEDSGIVEIEHNRLRFAHPLLARGVYSAAPPARRRETHRRLAEVLNDPELMARHVALAATSADRQTLQTLDDAAASARVRGAPAAAAELVELAIKIGGNTPERRIRLAEHHSAAGNAGRARALLEEVIEHPLPPTLRAHALSLLGVIAVLDGDFTEAEALLQRALRETLNNPAWRVQMLITLTFAHMNTGRIEAAFAAIEAAVTESTALKESHLLGAALGTRAMLGFMSGAGVDEPALQRALELDDDDVSIPVFFRPRLINALLMAYSGDLDRAHGHMLEVRRRCIERGEEGELVLIGFTCVMIEIWRGDFAGAALYVDDVTERAFALDGAFPRFIAHTCRAVLAAYAGRVDETRRNVADALAAHQGGDYFATAWPATTLGFLELSLGNYDAALTAVRPLLSTFDASSRGLEIISASCVPDAVEALIGLGRLAQAEPFVTALERQGRRLDRPWLLAVGARCRGMLLAAHGDLEAATAAAERALVEHRRLPMPFERARTQLLLGELQRQRRQRRAASQTLQEALTTFEQLDTPLWAARVHAALDRNSVRTIRSVLSPSEQRVAELVATGMTNRDVAQALRISPKTVEANLSRVYHKLDIRSRAELGHHLAELSQQIDSGSQKSRP